ncbi:hypothetical protein VNI00_011308 [Paramarasmius palmivorus]|uniref:Uncharacterized protein n=1 Tax=Paramarasmius palmivorus TaxID=297713 RepID=A0AAW0CEI0_9AGAR
MSLEESITKKVAIITGVSSGIGLATCKVFLSAGWSVFGVDVSPSPSIDNDNFRFLSINLTESSAPQTIVSGCHSAYGPRIDALLNVAGILDGFSGVDNLKDSDWDRTIAVNLTAPTRLMREVVKEMKEQTPKGGSIVNVCSKAATSGAVGGAAYTASKHGLLGITKNTAWLYKDDGIRCNAICPGGVKSNISSSVPSWDTEAIAKMRPVHDIHYGEGRGNNPGADPALAADVLLFLASDASKGISGAAVPVDNAWSTI